MIVDRLRREQEEEELLASKQQGGSSAGLSVNEAGSASMTE